MLSLVQNPDFVEVISVYYGKTHTIKVCVSPKSVKITVPAAGFVIYG